MIGNGPFNIVIPTLSLIAHIDAGEECQLNAQLASFGEYSIQISHPDLQIWEPRFHWASMDPTSDEIRLLLAWLEEILTEWDHSQHDQGSIRERESSLNRELQGQLEAESKLLFRGIAQHDLDVIKASATRLAGLGQGITPDGDDLMLGALLAVWMTESDAFATKLGDILVEAARDRTTLISRAWLMAASRGECTQHWHHLISAIRSMKKEAVNSSALEIMRQGFSSGRSALRGFSGVLQGYLDTP